MIVVAGGIAAIALVALNLRPAEPAQACKWCSAESPPVRRLCSSSVG